MQKRYIEFVKAFENRMSSTDIYKYYTNIIFLCVGTNKIMGDAIGPVVGDNLKYIENDFIKVYGTTKNTLNFSNAQYIIENIYERYQKPFLITIDAALGNKKNVEKIFIGNGIIKLGNALEKRICFYSDITIKCVVGSICNNKVKNIQELENVNFGCIFNMASIVSNGIINVLKNSKINV